MNVAYRKVGDLRISVGRGLGFTMANECATIVGFWFSGFQVVRSMSGMRIMCRGRKVWIPKFPGRYDASHTTKATCRTMSRLVRTDTA